MLTLQLVFQLIMGQKQGLVALTFTPVCAVCRCMGLFQKALSDTKMLRRTELLQHGNSVYKAFIILLTNMYKVLIISTKLLDRVQDVVSVVPYIFN